jgi:FkbH-like protein
LTDSVKTAFIRSQWQRVIFADSLSRSKLLSLDGRELENPPINIHVYRNQAFEFVASCLKPFLMYAGWAPVLTYSDYDDSLDFENWRSADLEIIWLDYERYAQPAAELSAWLEARIERLRALSTAPILVANWASDAPAATEFNQRLNGIGQSIPGVRVCDQQSIAQKLGAGYRDARVANLTGMGLSAAACLESARSFGLIWIPPAVRPRLKAIVSDLDNTLYAGVLGEDGHDGVSMTPAHARLQRTLLAFREQGVFLAVVSRNEASDVDRLFEARADFPLRSEHFSARAISWKNKSEGVRDVAAQLRIGTDSILVLDDNAGEIAEIAAHIPGIGLLHAANPIETACGLQSYPGLAGYEAGAADSLRISDAAAATQRAQQQRSTQNGREYMRSLNIEIQLHLNSLQHSKRLSELSNKTNQFNTGFLRASEAEAVRRMRSSEYATVSGAVRDQLSDSGTVAAIFARFTDDAIWLEEIAISCRALGRQIEDVLITEAVRGIVREHAAGSGSLSALHIFFREGPRNRPARDWLAARFGRQPANGEWLTIPLDCFLRLGDAPVSVCWGANELTNHR